MSFQENILGTDVPTIVVPSVTETPDQTPEFVKVRHMVFGPLRGLQETTHALYIRRYAAVNDWSQPQPSGQPGEYVIALIKRLRLG